MKTCRYEPYFTHIKVCEQQRKNDFILDFLDLHTTTSFKEAVITYISGYVVKMVQKRIKCDTCKEALTSPQEEATQTTSFSLQKRKTCGRLIASSSDVVTICLETEKHSTFLVRNENLSSLTKVTAKIVVIYRFQ